MSFKFLSLAPVLLLALAACNTMEGLGQDVQKGGQALENTADDAKKN